MTVADGRWRRPEVFVLGRLESLWVGAVAALCCCTLVSLLTVPVKAPACNRPVSNLGDL
jgi:hypothetical protein